jgi:hypothetical protein
MELGRWAFYVCPVVLGRDSVPPPLASQNAFAHGGAAGPRPRRLRSPRAHRARARRLGGLKRRA